LPHARFAPQVPRLTMPPSELPLDNAAEIGERPHQPGGLRDAELQGALGSRLTAQSVRLIVQRHLGADNTAHGLRAGFITEGARRGASAQALQQTSRHRSVNQLGEYIRHANVFVGTAHRLMED
jgi:integrase